MGGGFREYFRLAVGFPVVLFAAAAAARFPLFIFGEDFDGGGDECCPSPPSLEPTLGILQQLSISIIKSSSRFCPPKCYRSRDLTYDVEWNPSAGTEQGKE